MLQVVPDINPWAFRAFTPEECPPEVMRKLKFGEQLTFMETTTARAYTYQSVSSMCSNDVAKPIIDKAIETNKWQLYPELQFCKVNVALAETVGDGSIQGFLLKTYTNKQLINFDDSEESLNYWQCEYPKCVAISTYNALSNNGYIRIKDNPRVEVISIPTVYYSKRENLIYNKVRKLQAGELCAIPIFTSRHNGVLIVRAREECIVPLGSGRIRSSESAYELSMNSEFERVRADHLQGITSRYREFGCYEFADKSALLNILSNIPVDILYSLGTIKK